MDIDKNGYERGKINHSDLIHRQIAYEYIYLKHRERYPLPFSKYIVHHKDENKLNNDISNLEILTPEQHSMIHGYKTSQKNLDYLKEIEKQRRREEDKLSEEAIKVIKQIKITKEVKKKTKKIIITICIIVVAILLIFIFKGYIFNKLEPLPLTNQNPTIITSPEPTEKPYEVLVEGFSIKVINNQNKVLSLSVTYRRYSKWFGIDEQRTIEFLVPAKQEKSIVDEASNTNIATSNAPFSISIVDYKEN